MTPPTSTPTASADHLNESNESNQSNNDTEYVNFLSNLEQLKSKRGYYKQTLLVLESYVNMKDKPAYLPAIVNDQFNTCKTAKNQLETLASEMFNANFEEELESHFTEKSELDIFFHKLKYAGLNCGLSADNKPPNSSVIVNNNDNSQSGTIKLPPLTLPVFTGKFEEWLSFYESFKNAIINNKSLSNVHKLQYLRGSLRHEALEVIRSLDINSDNFQNAIDLLRDRYENKRIIIHNHVKAIFEMPSATKENYSSIRTILDNTLQHTRSLSAINRPVDKWDDLLIYVIVNKLPYNTRKDWEISICETNIPTFTELTEFLTRKCRTLAAIQTKEEHYTPRYNTQINKQYEKQVHCHVNNTLNNKFCHFCRSTEHYISQCKDYLNLTVEERYNFVRGKFLCVNCLRKNHTAKVCRSARCSICNKAHNSTLHRDVIENQITNVNNVTNAIESQASTSSLLVNSFPNVLLSTCIIFVKDNTGTLHEARALLDSGSQVNIITEKLINKLNLPLENTHVSIAGVNEKLAVSKKITEISFKSRYINFTRKINAIILDKICNNIPSLPIDPKLVKIPTNITLADEQFYKPREIDMLIGSEHFYDLMCVGQIRTNMSGIILQKSVLGWLIAGAIHNSMYPEATCALTNIELDESLTRFWKLESISDKLHMSSEESQCESHFDKTITRNESGRFIASLPFKQPPENLGNSLQIAENMFKNLEKKLYNNPQMKQEYDKFINEYLELNHMKIVGKISNEEIRNEFACYLPHHAVFKESSLTTKLRVVFNASAKTSNNISLNDILMKGPVLQSAMFDILLLFRFFKYVIQADISKMYRQILINSEHTKYQRILYRFSRETEILVCELLTLTYGTKPASFIATACLREIARHIINTNPRLAEIILKLFYMDDFLSGGDDIKQLQQLITEISLLFQGYGFPLVKWCSNCPDILKNLNNNDDTHLKIEFNDDDKFKTLGLSWVPTSDTIVYTHKFNDNNSHVSKRTILSNVAQIFDPLGLLGPYILLAKVLMQDIWKLKISWDESLPQDIATRWMDFCSDLNMLNTLSISRNLKQETDSKLELHAFADASELAYGVAIFCREIKTNGTINCNLICAKSRVAPLKKVTLARLELCAAVLLSEFSVTLTKALQSFTFSSIKFYSDSTIVLSWINATPAKWKTFVANRVAIIQENTTVSDWHHVRSEENAADIISRGSNLTNLVNSKLWWHGPQFLHDIKYSPKPFKQESNTEVPEVKSLVVVGEYDSQFLNLIIEKYSSYSKLLRVFAYCLRFVHNCKNPDSLNQNPTLSVDEITRAEMFLIKHIQLSYFSNEINLLKANKPINAHSKILPLTPFLSRDSILRVGGRLRHSSLNYDSKHQILLPKSTHFTSLIINYYHLRNLHSGAQSTLAFIRTKFWIVSGRDAVRLVVRKCVKCRRSDPNFPTPIMGDLPALRLQNCRPFSRSGCDFFGPFFIKEGSRKSRKIIKCYGCVFVCLATKAVHCELVENLTTEAFLASLKRFIARRGLVAEILCDNGTNFRGAANELKQVYENISNSETEIINNAVTLGIKWHFNPPRAPHFGGLFEAAVKVFKKYIYKIAGTANLTFVELYTLIVEIEAIMNSRPLVPVSSDANDFEYITPAHFLVGGSLMSLPEENLCDAPDNTLSRWQRVQQLRMHFWKRFNREYLQELQNSAKWRKTQGDSINVGQVVLVKEDNAPPRCWRLGRVTEIHPGPDGVVRVATIKTANGEIRRSVLRLCVIN